MQATLIFNGNAGNTYRYLVEGLLDGLHHAGFEPVYKKTDGIDDIKPILDKVSGLIVSAGGDGSAREIITRMIGRDDLFFTPLPMGTANNVCKTLNIEGDPIEIVKGLANHYQYDLDLGQLTAPWGVDYFVEGAGIGFFAEMLASYQPEKGKSVLRSMKSLIEIVQNGFAREATIRMGEKIVEGKFLLVEALNMTAIGPRLKFAPDADPGDGLLNIICIREENKDSYIKYLMGLLNEQICELDSVETYIAPCFDITWKGFPVHVDAEIHPPDFNYHNDGEDDSGYSFRPYPNLPESAVLQFDTLPRAIHVLIPQIEKSDA